MTAEDLSITTKLTNDIPSNLLPPKVFVQPFRLALKKGEDDEAPVSWVEVRSLNGLRNVFKKLAAGELVEIDRYSSVEMQLWGLLAEHSGFMRAHSSDSAFAAGIQPCGEQTAALADDFSIFTGGDEIAALGVLDSMRNLGRSRPLDNTPMEQPEITNEFVKPDGVNLTEKGEDALQTLVYGEVNMPNPEHRKHNAEAVAFRKDSENAVEIFLGTPAPTMEERIREDAANLDCVHHGDKPLSEICKENAKPSTGPVVTGPEAAMIGRLVADVRRGLDNEDDRAIQEEAQAALDILDAMIEIERRGLAEVRAQAHDLFERHGVSMEELAKLVADSNRRSRQKAEKSALADSPREAVENQTKNFQKLMADLSELALFRLVDESPVEAMTPEERAQHDQIVAERRSKIRESAVKSGVKLVEESDQTYGSDHYKPREVKPASEVPTDQDERAKWLEDQRKSNDGGDSSSSS